MSPATPDQPKTGGTGDLLALTAELVAIPSVSHREHDLADKIEADLSKCTWLEVERAGDNVIGRTRLGHAERICIAGHLDTVPAAGNEVPRREGDTLWGLGAADMKGGLAVMLDLATSLAEPAVDVTWCFYACEEVARRHNGLVDLFVHRPDLLQVGAAVLLEPTDTKVEAGCQGTLRAVVQLGGVRAHTARPQTGRNAIHRLVPVLERVTGWEGRTVVLDGCVFAEQVQAVGVEGGVASNVVPDHTALTLNHRFAPDRDGDGAHQFVAELLDGVLDPELGDRIDVVEVADGAPPSLSHPLLASLVALSGAPPRAKLGWTDVATMWQHGIAATNFGPGDPRLAHRADEHVTGASLERARSVLASVLRGAKDEGSGPSSG